MSRVALLAALTALLLMAGAGCGAKKEESKPTAEHYGPDTVSTEGSDVEIGAKSGAGDQKVAAQETKTAGAPNRVRLTQHGCIEFEPKWTTIRVGQSLSWHSDLKLSVTIHVPAGAFDKTEYLVRAGQNVSTGPARHPGNYPMWSSPAACQGIARGVQGSGPGVAVEGAPTR